MRLHIKDDELDLQIEIKNWTPLEYDEDDELIGYPWCEVDMPWKTHYLDYNSGGEIWDRGEILEIKDYLKDFLDGTMKEEKTLSFIEPDLALTFCPEHTLYSVPGKVVYRDGKKVIPALWTINLNFWIGHRFLGTGEFRYIFNRSEAEAFYHYLQLITGEIEKTSPVILNMIDAGTLSED